ncbi:MAG: hypothetical protein Q7V57_10265 [Actinomycetota bacterium]|nr:hypothetical protein [Actinomycetota bacterium]
MKIRSRVWLAAATLLASTTAIGATTDQASAGPIAGARPGDGSAVVYIAAGGAPGLTNAYRYNSSGGDIEAGQIDATHYWISFRNLGGGTYVNAQLTNWNASYGPAVDPVCTIDKTKDTGIDVTVWFRCVPYPGDSLETATMFINVTNRTHPDRAGVVAPGFVALTTADAAAAMSTPLNQYRSSGFGAATVARTGVGTYTVTIPNGTFGWNEGTVFTTALSVSPAVDPAYTRYCNPQSWSPSGTSMRVFVRCYHGGGLLSDARFSLRYTTHNHMGGTQPGGAQWVHTPNSAGYVAAGYGWNSAGGTNFVATEMVPGELGISRVTFNGGTHAPARIGSLMVVAYGGNHRCSLEFPGSGSEGYTFATVRCYQPLGGAAVPTGKYSVSLAQM